jgi:hypothetical protein
MAEREPIRPLAAAGGDPAAGGPRQGLPWHPVPLLLLLSGPVVLALVVLDAPTWLRAGPVLCYLAVVPGLAGIRLLRLADRLMEILLGIGLSLAAGILVAQSMIYLHVWSPILGVSAVMVIASVAAVLDLVRGGDSR